MSYALVALSLMFLLPSFYGLVDLLIMGTNRALFANLFCLVMRRDCLLFLSDKNHADAIETFNFTSRYLVDLQKIDIPLL